MCKRQLNGHLVEIRSQAEYDFFLAFLKTLQGDVREQLLLGATYKNGFWSYVSSQLEITFAKWYDDEATPSDENQGCQFLVWNSNDEGMHSWVCETVGDKRTNTRHACQVDSPPGKF